MTFTEQERDRLFGILEDIRRLLGSGVAHLEELVDRTPLPPPSSRGKKVGK